MCLEKAFLTMNVIGRQTHQTQHHSKDYIQIWKKNLLKTYPAQNKAVQVYKIKLKLSSGIK